MGLFDKAKAKLQEKLDEVTTPEPDQSPEMLRKQVKAVAVVGGEYPCRKDKKTMRDTAEKGIRIGSRVTIERYTYQGQPAYMVINSKNSLDIGVLSQGMAFKVSKQTKAKVIQGEIVDTFSDASGRRNWKVYLDLED